MVVFLIDTYEIQALYFGVGGGTRHFQEVLKSTCPALECKVVATLDDGASNLREVLLLSKRHVKQEVIDKTEAPQVNAVAVKKESIAAATPALQANPNVSDYEKQRLEHIKRNQEYDLFLQGIYSILFAT